MTKFSLDEDEGEGSNSNGVPKRPRLVSPPRGKVPPPVYRPRYQPPEEDDNSDKEEEEGEEEEEEEEEGEEVDVDEDDDAQEQEQSEDDEDSVPVDSVPVVSDPDKSISACFTDPDVLDCPICFEHLTVPVFQCMNGHIACSSCCTKIHNKCPSCAGFMGYSRCRAIEKVLETAKVACQYKQYGCKETVFFSQKKEHEKNCPYPPCSCPLPGCNFVSSYQNLYLHFRREHSDSAMQFCFETYFSVELTKDAKFVLLREKNEGMLFLLNRNEESLGSIIWLSCMSSPSIADKYRYEISSYIHPSTLKLQSTPKSTQGPLGDLRPTGYLLLPSNFFSCTNIYVSLRISEFMSTE